eukprot:TRINITY_DN321_c0_g1_i1.p1 TRINITY_DN321_c0_g1~~TRINITY_DN321_c0_g1_i1.p1  ORF type:complete len:299 (-),score=49.64 TRINITY_DN321_c0_g1_i1:316-1212(-)
MEVTLPRKLPLAPPPASASESGAPQKPGATHMKLEVMDDDHLHSLLKVQRLCYEPCYRESRSSYSDRTHIYPDGNVVLTEIVPSNNEDEDMSDDLPPMLTLNYKSKKALKKKRKMSGGATAPSIEEVEDPDVVPMSTSPDTIPHSLSYLLSKQQESAPQEPKKQKVLGYIVANPFRRGQTNDVDDTKLFSKWIEKYATQTESGSKSVLARDLDKDCIYIHEIATHPDYRGRGLATPLVAYTEELARAGGFKWMSLVALGPALGFWKRQGYHVVEEIDYEGHICYYMEKKVPEAPSHCA